MEDSLIAGLESSSLESSGGGVGGSFFLPASSAAWSEASLTAESTGLDDDVAGALASLLPDDSSTSVTSSSVCKVPSSTAAATDGDFVPGNRSGTPECLVAVLSFDL